MIPRTGDARVEARIDRQRVFCSALVEAGRFEAAPDAPDFRSSGPPGRFLLALPETCVRIRHRGRPPFVTNLSTVTFYNPEDEYTREAVDARGDRCTWIAFAPELVEEAVAECSTGRPAGFVHRFGPADPGTFLASRGLLDAMRHGGGADTLLVEEVAVTLLHRLVRSAYAGRRALASRQERVGARARASHRRLLRRALEVLEQPAGDDPLSLAMLAKRTGCSPFHLCRVFREQTGMPVHRYRTRLRAYRAVDLMRTSGRSLSDTAAEVGLASHSHLTALFQRLFHRPPSRLRDHRAMLDGGLRL